MRKAVLQTIGLAAVVVAALFVSAGTLAWPMGWAVLVFYVAFAVAGFVWLPPELIAERSRLAGGDPGDLVVAGLALLFLLPITLVVSGIDVRLGASPEIPPGIQFAAFGVFALGYAVSLWAARSNPFFSSVVRVQRERDHRVVTRGPYAFVRHPGYAGPIAGHLALPIALGSLWGLVPAALGGACLVVRIGYEERVLREGLAGYTEYAERVRWRLMPGLW